MKTPLFAAALLGPFLAGCVTLGLAPVAEANPPAAAAASAPAPAPAPAASLIAPMVEKRETLVATGYAVISVQNHKLPAQQRLMAIRASKLDAYRALTEQVYGQHLDASTTVADMVVMNDTFRTRVEGVVYGAVLVSITPVGDDTYETTLSLDRQVVNDLRALYLGQLAARRK
ncbi:MAG: LPP20 family lipoprotein [Ramlibacter sp.]